MKSKTTIEDILDKLTGYRMDGNSTRCVDNAIQLLFKGYTVVVLDHWHDGEHREANKDLFDKIVRRVHNEHRGLIENKQINFDRNRLEISLKS